LKIPEVVVNAKAGDADRGNTPGTQEEWGDIAWLLGYFFAQA